MRTASGATVIAAILVGATASCAAASPDTRVYFIVELKVGSTRESLKNIHYTFGDELLNRIRPSAIPGSPFENYSAPPRWPQVWEVGWPPGDSALKTLGQA